MSNIFKCSPICIHCGYKGTKHDPLIKLKGKYVCYDCLLRLISYEGVQIHSFDED